jgi:hypothetical protein
MKTFIITLTTFASLAGFSFGRDHGRNFYSRPAGRIVSGAKTASREVVRLPAKAVNKCVNGRCNRTY